MGDPALEDRRGLGRFLVHVGVEFVAGELGEMLDVLEGDGAAAGLQRVADMELAHPLAERVDVDDVLGRAGDILLGDRGDHRRRGLDRGALHVMLDAADAAHLLAAAGAAGAAMDEDGEGRAVAGRFGGVGAVDDQHPAVIGGGALHEIARRVGRVGEERQRQAAHAAIGERDGVVDVACRA